MLSFAQTVMNTAVPEGKAAVFALGQAGFLFKTSSNRLLAVDPYLSDRCERLVHYKRLMAFLMDPTDLRFDVIAVSHSHPDHFDTDSIPLMMTYPEAKLICAEDCRPECEQMGLAGRTAFLRAGEEFCAGDISVRAIPCDHGEQAPLAVGFLFSFSGKIVCFMGDTAYREDWLCNADWKASDLLILPINGAFGNLNGVEAAKACSLLRPKLAIPCHYWNFAEHLGDPYQFMQAMEREAPEVPYLLMRQGEGILF